MKRSPQDQGHLAQYREMAAFRIWPDLGRLDAAPLARGSRLTELLKQPQFSPLRWKSSVRDLGRHQRYLDGIPVPRSRLRGRPAVAVARQERRYPHTSATAAISATIPHQAGRRWSRVYTKTFA